MKLDQESIKSQFINLQLSELVVSNEQDGFFINPAYKVQFAVKAEVPHIRIDIGDQAEEGSVRSRAEREMAWSEKMQDLQLKGSLLNLKIEEAYEQSQFYGLKFALFQKLFLKHESALKNLLFEQFALVQSNAETSRAILPQSLSILSSKTLHLTDLRSASEEDFMNTRLTYLKLNDFSKKEQKFAKNLRDLDSRYSQQATSSGKLQILSLMNELMVSVISVVKEMMESFPEHYRKSQYPSAIDTLYQLANRQINLLRALTASPSPGTEQQAAELMGRLVNSRDELHNLRQRWVEWGVDKIWGLYEMIPGRCVVQ